MNLGKQGSRKSRDAAALWHRYCQTWKQKCNIFFLFLNTINTRFIWFHLGLAMKIKTSSCIIWMWWGNMNPMINDCSQTFWNTCSLCPVGQAKWSHIRRHHSLITSLLSVSPQVCVVCSFPNNGHVTSPIFFTKTLLLLPWRLQYRLEEAGSPSSL